MIATPLDPRSQLYIIVRHSLAADVLSESLARYTRYTRSTRDSKGCLTHICSLITCKRCWLLLVDAVRATTNNCFVAMTNILLTAELYGRNFLQFLKLQLSINNIIFCENAARAAKFQLSLPYIYRKKVCHLTISHLRKSHFYTLLLYSAASVQIKRFCKSLRLTPRTWII